MRVGGAPSPLLRASSHTVAGGCPVGDGTTTVSATCSAMPVVKVRFFTTFRTRRTTRLTVRLRGAVGGDVAGIGVARDGDDSTDGDIGLALMRTGDAATAPGVADTRLVDSGDRTVVGNAGVALRGTSASSSSCSCST